ncbi:MAG: hypothetical protein ACPLW7_06855, partial [Minisyncoccia bacterium]
AYVEVYAPANDLGVVVYDYFQNIKTAYSHDLPNQYVAIVREEIKDSKGNVLSPRTKLLEAWTPYNGTYGSDVSGTRKLRAVLLKSTPNNILWGFYGVEIFTANVTQSEATKPNNFVIPSENEFKAFTDYKLPNGTTIKGGTGGWIADKQVRPQWLAKYLEGATGGVDWSTGVYSLQWPAKLSITIPRLEGADVYVVDARTNYNVSVARTGKTGEASVVENVKLDTAHNPTNDPFIVPSAYALGQPVTLDLGFNLLNGTYIVKVVYQNAIVYDTFTDQPQHRYIYLGVVPPPTATGEDYDNAQTRTFPPKVAYSLMLKVIDQSPATRPLESAEISLTAPFATYSGKTSSDGTWALDKPLPLGSYNVTVSYSTKFGVVSTRTKVSIGEPGTASATIQLPIYDIVVKVVSPRGTPLVHAGVKVGGVSVGTTDATGAVAISQIPAGSYPVSITWLGTDVSPTAPLSVALSQAYLVTASKIATVTVQVLGAQNQGLAGATVTIGPIT